MTVADPNPGTLCISNMSHIQNR